jgi:hypothetical protein
MFKELFETKIEVSGSYIKFPDSQTSLGSDDAVVVSNKREEAKIWKDGSKIMFQTNKYDKTFSDLKSLVKFLNKEKFKYNGIDSIPY